MIPDEDLQKIKEGFDLYQKHTQDAAAYPTIVLFDNGKDISWVFALVGLLGETGELSEKLKKIMRDKDGEISDTDKDLISKEQGDTLWYNAQICTKIGTSFGDSAKGNLIKLQDRKERNKIHGSGDCR